MKLTIARTSKPSASLNILSATDDFQGLLYRPQTKETKQIYELILAFVHRFIGDVSQEILRGAADETIAILKDDLLKDFDRKKQIESTIGSLSSDDFAQLVNLGKRITDFQAEEEKEAAQEDTVDQEYGVAVVFDEDEDDEEASSEDEDYEMDEAELIARQTVEEIEPMEGVEEEFEAIQDQGRKAKEDTVDPREVDAFWLQRLLSKPYPDALEAQNKSDAAYQLLASDMPLKECENELVALFEYEHFDIVKTLTKNRDAIVWCTKLAKGTSEAEKKEIKSQMKSLGLSAILQRLDGSETSSRKKHEQTSEMDIDEKMNVAEQRAKSLALADKLAPKKAIDLESLIFQQGGHLMSNKKCKLPEGSFKKTKKGYEEVHVPAPKPKPMSDKEKLVPIASLPEWAQRGFPTAKSLNRIQSKVYPWAFKTDENMLVCAPTGAGKVPVLFFSGSETNYL